MPDLARFLPSVATVAILTQISPTTAALVFLVDDTADATHIFTKLSRQEGYASRPDERVTADLRALGALVKFKPLWADDLLDFFAKSLTHAATQRANGSPACEATGARASGE